MFSVCNMELFKETPWYKFNRDYDYGLVKPSVQKVASI